MHSAIHSIIESRPLAEVSHLHPSFLQQTVQVATQSACKRNDCWFIAPAVQASQDMDRHALGATGAQHRNYVDNFDLFHDLVSRLVEIFSFTGYVCERSDCNQHPETFGLRAWISIEKEA